MCSPDARLLDYVYAERCSFFSEYSLCMQAAWRRIWCVCGLCKLRAATIIQMQEYGNEKCFGMSLLPTSASVQQKQDETSDAANYFLLIIIIQ